MALIRTCHAWLSDRWALMTDRASKDRGDQVVSYMVVILFIALIAAALVSTNIPTTIATYVDGAVKKVWTDGKGGAAPAAPPAAPPKK